MVFNFTHLAVRREIQAYIRCILALPATVHCLLAFEMICFSGNELQGGRTPECRFVEMQGWVVDSV